MTIDYARARETMVEQQVRPWDVLDARVLEALNVVPRDAFVSEAYRALAYADLELPIGHGKFMMKPVVEGRMLQALAIDAGDEVLEIGTGSGFIGACLGYLARDVHSLEIVPELAESARARLAQLGYGNNVRVETADALAWDTSRRFDAICVTAAVDTTPPRFLEWLRPGGRLFVVRGRAPVMEAVCLHPEVNGLRTESLFETELQYLVGAAPKAEFHL
jgi:protein-L-isoaspartate(D-aspartate) O-methyltransferase